ncbi:MAG: hypothetical protein Q9178_005228 [Gyalolechia marmorata]
MSKKRRNVDEEGKVPTSLDPLTAAANFNRMVIRKLQRALEVNLEVDLTSVLPTKYSKRLNAMKHQPDGKSVALQIDGISNALSETDPIPMVHTPTEHLPEIIFPLSETVHHLLGTKSGEDVRTSCNLLTSLSRVVQSGQVLWQSETCRNNAVVKCNSEVVVKIVPDMQDYTEFSTLQYIANNMREIPSPMPLGLIKMSGLSYMFMSFIEGITLEKAWLNMIPTQKQSVTEQLDNILAKMRQHQRPYGAPFGGTSGEGCKDTRRHTRISTSRIDDCSQFQDFQFSKPTFGSEAYVKFLRGLLPDSDSLCVFTHGDLRKENIMISLQDNGDVKVTGLIDWEMSGFYPEYFECTKVTNTMSSLKTDDWYLQLPYCISPYQYPARWLLDRLWDAHVV